MHLFGMIILDAVLYLDFSVISFHIITIRGYII
jgi:hypothetical protein